MKLCRFLKTAAVLARNAALGGNLISLSLLGQPRRMADYMRQCLFLYQTYTATRGLPQKNVFEVLPAKDVETVHLGDLRRPTSLYGEPWFHAVTSYSVDLINLCLICQIIKPGVVFEIGTLHGYMAFHCALNTPPDCRIYTLDLPKGQATVLASTAIDDDHIDSHNAITTYRFDGSPVADKITCLFGDSATFDYSPYGGKVDLFFIDGAHSYDYVRSDTLCALECCHPGSVMVWHDYGRLGVNGVSRWLTELSRTRQVYSIPGGSLAFMVVE